MSVTGGIAPARRELSRRDAAAAAIREWIVDGRFRPGQQLVETTIGAELGMSRVPVRQALQTLAAEGFVDVTPGHPARVASPTARDLLDMYEVRAALEAVSCRSAAQRRTTEDLARLDELVALGAAAAQAADWPRVEELNLTFHRTISLASGNRHLAELIVGYRAKLFWLHRGAGQRRGAQAWDEHRAIVEHIRAGEGSEAARAGYQHTEVNRELFLAELTSGRGAVPWA